MKSIINDLFHHKTLNRSEAKSILTRIANGEFNDVQIGVFLTVFNMREITPEELVGFREALLELCIAVDFSEYDTIDVCGTGGDGKDTFNISTTSAFVIAGAGYKVAKHGNYGVSSNCGSSDVLQYLGYEFTNDLGQLSKNIENSNFTYLHAPLFHPAMKAVGPARKQMGVKTFFNILGPLVNPSKPGRQLTGVFSRDLIKLYKYVFDQSNQDFAVLYSEDGYDEISLTSSFAWQSSFGQGNYSPLDLGFKNWKQSDLYGGDSVEDSAKIMVNILDGNGSKAQEEVVLANAGFGIKLFNQEKSILDCIGMAKESIDSGSALQKLKKATGKV